MQKSLKEIAQIIQGEIVGDSSIMIRGVSGIKEAKEGDITFFANSKYSSLIDQTNASAIITSRNIESTGKSIIRTDNPSLAFTKVISVIMPRLDLRPTGIHPTAIISKSAKLGKDVSLGPYVIVEDDVVISNGSVIYGNSYIGHKTQIGKNCLIYPSVSIREDTRIGDRVIIQNGSVIGSDGFGYIQVNGEQKRIPQIGTVVIEDDVDIGANVTIDRARFDKTIIGKGTKIDNLVQIAHNVIIGNNSIIVAQVGISGSTEIGQNVILAGQAGVVGHITIGDNVIVAAQAGVTKSIPSNTKVSGYPAKSHDKAKRVNACLQKLPDLYKRIDKLETKIKELESKLNDQ